MANAMGVPDAVYRIFQAYIRSFGVDALSPQEVDEIYEHVEAVSAQRDIYKATLGNVRNAIEVTLKSDFQLMPEGTLHGMRAMIDVALNHPVKTDESEESQP